MASYSSNVSYSNSYSSASSFTSAVTGSSHSNTRYYHFAVTWWDGESDVRIYQTSGSLSAGTNTKTFTVSSSSYVKSGETYTIHFMWGTTNPGTTTYLDSLSGYQYYNTTTYTHSGGSSTYTLTLTPGTGISYIQGYLTTDYSTRTIYSSTSFSGLSSGDSFYVSGVGYETNYSYPVSATAASGSGTFTMINSAGSWSDHYISMSSKNRSCTVTATYSPPTTYTITYKGNGGSSGRSSDTGEYGTYVTLPNASMSSEYETAYRYYITYNANGGSCSSSGSYTQCTATTSHPLNGWYTSSSGGSYVGTYGSYYEITCNESLWAQYGSSTSYSNSTLSSLPTPTWSGHTFLGWYTASSGGTQVTTSTVFTSSKTIYAQWQANTADVDMYYLYGSTQIATSGTVTENIGTRFYINDHIKSINGYTYSYSSPSSDFYISEDTEVNYYYTVYSESPTIVVDEALANSITLNVTASSQPYARTVSVTCNSTTKTVTLSANSTISPDITFTGLQSGYGYSVSASVIYDNKTQGSTSKTCYTNYAFSGFDFISGDPSSKLEASEWNTFNNLLVGKCDRYGKTYSYTVVSAGDSLSATAYNKVIDAFKSIGYTDIEIVAPKVSSGDQVAAYPFSVFKSYLNSDDN